MYGEKFLKFLRKEKFLNNDAKFFSRLLFFPISKRLSLTRGISVLAIERGVSFGSLSNITFVIFDFLASLPTPTPPPWSSSSSSSLENMSDDSDAFKFESAWVGSRLFSTLGLVEMAAGCREVVTLLRNHEVGVSKSLDGCKDWPSIRVHLLGLAGEHENFLQTSNFICYVAI